MFNRLGDVISRWWYVILGLWIAALVGLRIAASPFNDLAKGGVFVFLPENMPSRKAEQLLEHAFPGRQTSSSLVIVVYRDEDKGLTDADRSFIDDTLEPALEKIRDRTNQAVGNISPAGQQKSASDETGFIKNISTYSTRGIGNLLVSDDEKASLITIDLASDFQDSRNWEPVQNVSSLLSDLEHGTEIPKGLHFALTGSATLGRDITFAEAESARNTATLTITLVVILLITIYRAPLLALVPLLSIFVAVDISLHLLALLAQLGYVPIFKGLKEYVTVITYGPGIDYCLFLIARYKENLMDQVPSKQGLAQSIGQVGPAIAASGGTVICGIGMLTFAQFGKFHEAGIGIGVALAITLVATLTLTPSLLMMTGHWAFWPKSGIRYSESAAQVVPKGEAAVQKNLFELMWAYIGNHIERSPLLLLLGTLAGMVPFSVLAIAVYGGVNYGLLESLPKSATSSAGARVLEKYFPAGIVGTVHVLLQDPGVNFKEQDGIAIVHDLVEKLMKRRDELMLADIRSVAAPLGMSTKVSQNTSDGITFTNLVERKVARNRINEHYVTEATDLDGQVTVLEVVLNTNPFAVQSANALAGLAKAIHQSLPAEQAAKSTIAFIGPTASVHDLITISHSDQQRIYVLVVTCVFVILVVLLRSVTLSLYLIATVILSYLCTLGVTWLFFYSLDTAGFAGLDWTVPLFLFVVLIAVGEDYNIFLVTRIHEEQSKNGPKHGITVALARTGGIITSCGFIMAGSFSSLCAGSLARMQQLGFALAIGVLLDTFVIRPILVPAFIMVLNDERYGNLSRYLK